MNGAIAEPLVSTTRPPKTTIMIRIGSSQNFLRTRMKRQSSPTNSIIFSLELVLHCIRRGPGRRAHDPVARSIRLAPEPQQILAHGAQHEAGRKHRAVEQ